MINLQKISKKWQKKWEEAKIFEVKENPKKKKCYVLEMYPYPSASFLHMGHVRNYTIGDVYARYKRMQGYNVLYPMGYDSFGLPAETAAKKEGVHPRIYAEEAIKKIKKYQKALGNSYDWTKTLASHDPDYYKWNQFFFVKLFEKGLAYRKKSPVNWCETCSSVLANEEAEGGTCWRCEKEVIKKDLKQWFLKITDYADQLLDDLNKIEWPEKIVTMQKNWIGKSHGTEIDFEINSKKWSVFTTRADTIYGITFMVVSAQHPKLKELVTKDHEKEMSLFLKKVLRVRTQEEIEQLEKEGFFTGTYATHPLTHKKIPIYASNFVIADYGCGLVMGVPAHDQRDFEFAKKFNLPIIEVVCPPDKKERFSGSSYTDYGILINSEHYSGMKSEEAIEKITSDLAKRKLGRKSVNYKIRDWMISRQRYWGTPIPIVYCKKCGVVPVPEKDLPVLLPKKVDFNKAGNALATNRTFVNTKCPKCNSPAERETDTMGGFVDSSWYFLRYCDNKNKQKPFDPKKINYWMPVDQYIGGAEHAVMHLIYARFFVKSLKDLGLVDFDEPFSKLFNQGIVYKDGAKMSKSKNNVVYQTDISDKYGIDTARLFLMFVASPDKLFEWTDAGIEGAYRFMKRLVALLDKGLVSKTDELTQSKMHLTIKLVTENIESFQYNKAIIAIMEYTNYLFNLEKLPRQSLRTLLLLLSPFAPHTTEEMWSIIGEKGFISLANWPKYDNKKIKQEILLAEEVIKNTIEDINSVLRLAKIDKPSEISLFVSEPWKYKLYKIIEKQIKTSYDFKTLMDKVMKNTVIKNHGQETSKIIQKIVKSCKGVDAVLDAKFEHKVFVESKDFFEREFRCKVVVEQADKSKEPKAKQALPGKPAIIIK